jgi:hypothetical protein
MILVIYNNTHPMDSVFIVNPVHTQTSASFLEAAWQVATILLTILALISLFFTRRQINQTTIAISDAARTNLLQRQDIQEQHQVRLREIMPWFVAAEPLFNEEIRFKNVGGRATSLGISCGWMHYRELSPRDADIPGGRLSVRLEMVPRNEYLPVIVFDNDLDHRIATNRINCTFTITYSDDLGNRYKQEGAWQATGFFTRDPEMLNTLPTIG